MRTGTWGFVPGRLTEARAARRIPSMSALARTMSLNPSTVSRWEDGTSAPDAEALARLAQHFEVRPEFFFRPTNESARPVFFRSLSSTLVRDLNYQQSQMRWLQEISHAVEHYVDLPPVDVPDVMGKTSYQQLRDSDLEQIALDLRKHWGLGEGPCADMVPLLERVGFVVSVIEMGTIKLDGLCSWSSVDDRPHVLLASDKMSFARRQMDAAHEMAHAVLHKNVSPEDLKKDLKLIESQAFRLGSAFLLPSTTYPVEMRAPSLDRLVTAKERWRVAIKAQIKRLSDLRVIPPEYVVHLYKMHSAKGWTKQEPFDRQWTPTEPRVLRDALHLIVDEGVRAKSDLMALEFTVSAGDIENLAGLSPGWFSRERATVSTLKPSDRAPHSAGGTIVHFPPRGGK